MSAETKARVRPWIRCGGDGTRRRSRLAALASLVATAAVARPFPNGGELQVNTLTSQQQINPAVAADGAGRFVVVWQSTVSGGDDTSSYSIQLQRYSATGAPVGGQVQVNSYTSGAQSYPGVAVRTGGEFVVVWQSYGSGYDPYGFSIRARRFDATGTPVGAEFQVNTFTSGDQRNAAVAVDSLGRTVVVWDSEGSSAGDTSFTSVHAQRYAADGAPAGAPMQVNSYTTDYQGSPAVAIDPQGNFVVAWQSDASNYDADDYSIQASIFNAAGAPLTGQFQVSSSTTGPQVDAAVAANGLGQFLVVWNSASSAGTDTSAGSIQAQYLDAQGGLGDEFQVNSFTPGSQSRPAVAGGASNGFVVVWNSDGSAGSDIDASSIQAQYLGGADFQVNTYTTGSQADAAVAADAAGNFVVTWNGNGSAGTDTSLSSIHAQRYDALFRDGFESGGSGRWSSSLP